MPHQLLALQICKPKLRLKTGQRGELSAALLPPAPGLMVTWYSTNPAVASVHADGRRAVIQGKQPGRAVIIASAADGCFRDVCVVHVQDYMMTHR
ncbi:Ig-like domain-containing protein [Ectobacillus ponti]|uniref:Ig-like domain-containing protein n=1 Tax=Ectobacillus ponti TaxID=2961894 RepID=A0AA42BNU3_9BACI|nr:Ig-like domain-containing protein [Ectobacillus ponti]MCP8968365.1 Ig-like domain-containing protein [Ectobacillus ponti]